MCKQGISGELGGKSLTSSKDVYNGKAVYTRKTCESLSLTVVSFKIIFLQLQADNFFLKCELIRSVSDDGLAVLKNLLIWISHPLQITHCKPQLSTVNNFNTHTRPCFCPSDLLSFLILTY